MSSIEIIPLSEGVAVSFPHDSARNDRLRKTFPKARWSPDRRLWIIPGKRAARRASLWLSEEEARARSEQLEEDKARDALAFDPLPSSPWVRVAGDAIVVETPYAPALVDLLGSLGGRWCEATRAWRLPFRSAGRLRRALPDLDRMAIAARAEAERRKAEMEARKAERNAEQQARREERERRQGERRREKAERARDSLMARAFGEPPRPLRREFMTPRPGAPKHHFEIELFDAMAVRGSPLAAAVLAGRPPSSWVAQIWASCPRYGLCRSFLIAIKDYSRANSTGSRGVHASYILEEGPIYEVRQQVSWHKSERYFLRIWDGHRTIMTEEEVRACLDG